MPYDFERLYKFLLEVTIEISQALGQSIPKWKRDILLILLEKSMEKPAPKRKILRRKVRSDLEKEL